MAAQLKGLSGALYCTGLILHFIQSRFFSFSFVIKKQPIKPSPGEKK